MNAAVLQAIGLAASLVAMSGCEYKGAESLPLPGGVDADDGYTVTVVLADATNLVPRETCRSNDTVIGSVESVTLDDDLKARIVCRIRHEVKVPANAAATLRETSLLGERFVALDPPAGQQPRGVLEAGSEVPETLTRADPNVELVLGALSQVLNGGSLGSIETITRELNTALESSDVRGSIRQFGSVVGKLNRHRDDIASSLRAMERFSGRLARQREVLEQALDSIPGGLAVLDRQRPKLVAALRTLSRLSRVALPLIDKSRENTVADLEHLAPVLRQLTKQGRELSGTLGRLATWPFPTNASSIVGGDYGGFYGTVVLDIDMLNELLGGAGLPSPDPGGNPTPPPTGPLPETPTLPGLPELPELPTIPGLPEIDLGQPADQPLDLGGLLLGGS